MTRDVQAGQDEGSVETEFLGAHFRLPPFPRSAYRILQSINDEDASILHFSNLVSSDPALSCEVLIIANSALLAQRHRVTSILQAIVLLGTRTLRGVCLTVAIRAYLGKSMNHPSLRAVWRHSLACALIAEQLAGAAAMDKGTAYTRGIMHEIGRFALAVLRPEEYAGLLEKHCGSALSILESERLMFGFDHREAGRHLIREWKLPLEFETEPQTDDCTKRLTDPWLMHDLVQMSCHLAETAGFAAFAGCEVTPYRDLLESLPVRGRSLFPADVKRLAFDIGNKISAIESA